MNKQFGGKYDKIIADQANQEAEEDRKLRCQAHGCPMPWSSDFGMGRFCRWHRDKKPYEWPEITRFTQAQFDLEAQERQNKRNNRNERYANPEKLREILEMLAQKPDPLDWARRLRQREESGEKLSMIQKEAWRKALKVTL